MAPPSKQNSKQPKTQNTATSVARRKVRRKPKQPDPAYVHVSWWSMLVVVLVSGGFGLYLGRLYRIIAFRNLQVTQVKWVRSSIIPRVRSFLNATTTTTTTETHTDHQELSQLRLQETLQQQTELLLQPVLFTHPNPQKVAIVVAGKNNNNKNNLHQHFPRRRENDDDEEEDFVVGWFVSQIQRHKPIQEIWVASAVSSSSVSFQLVVEQAGDVKTNDVDDSDDDDSDDDDDDDEAEEDQCEVSPSKNDEATKGPLDVVIIVE